MYATVVSGVVWSAFLVWYFFVVREYKPTQDKGLIGPMLLASLWILAGSPLMVLGEHGLNKLLHVWDAEGTGKGWSIGRIQTALERADGSYKYFAILGAVLPPFALVQGKSVLQGYLPIRGVPTLVLGALVVSFVGWVSANGAWGATKALLVQRAATRSQGVAWKPFHPQQLGGVEALYKFAWSTGLIFSVGSTFAPAIGVVALDRALPASVRFVLALFLILLAFGGFLLFTFPLVWLQTMTRKQKERELENIADAIDPIRGQALTDPSLRRDSYYRLQALVLIRQGTVAETAAPYNFALLGRAVSTLLIPLAAIAIPLVHANPPMPVKSPLPSISTHP